jgi:choline dehydrogenase-like flavoprotein
MVASHGLPTLLLEAGGHHRGAIVNLHGRVVARVNGSPHRQPPYDVGGDPATTWYAHEGLGGLSNYWTCAVPRYAPGDFIDGLPLGEEFAWPIGYEDLTPYYSHVERLLSVWGTSSEFETLPAAECERHVATPAEWQAIAPFFGTRPLARIALARGQHRVFQTQTTQFNSYHDLLRRELPRLPSLVVRPNARVVRLEFDPKARRVTSVGYLDTHTGASVEVPVRAVILAAGAIVTPTLLLNSTSDTFPDGLGNTSGLIGHYLHDHTHHLFKVHLAKRLPRLGHPLILGRRAYDPATPLSGSQCTIGGRLTQLDRALTLVPGLSASRFGMVVFGVAVPRASDNVAPVRSGPHAGRPLITHAPVDEASRAVVQELESEVLRGFDRAGLSPELYWRTESHVPGTAIHYAGTVRMHASPTLGPADSWSRLHDVANVAIGDASVFPYSSEKNPTLTAMALSVRAADRLAREVLDGRF